MTIRRVECTKRSLLMVMLIKPLGATEHWGQKKGGEVNGDEKRWV